MKNLDNNLSSVSDSSRHVGAESYDALRASSELKTLISAPGAAVFDEHLSDAEGSVGWTPSPRARALDRIIGYLLVGLLVSDVSVVFVSMILRYGFGFSISWNVQVTQILLAGIVFLGSAVAFHKGEHRSLRLLLDVLPPRLTRVIDSFTLVLAGAIAVAMLYSGISWYGTMHGVVLGTSIPAAVTAVPFLAGSVLLLAYCVLLMLDRGAKQLLWGLACSAVLGAVIVLSGQFFQGGDSLSAAFGFYIVIFFVLLLLGIPVGFCFVAVTFGLSLAIPDLVPMAGVSRRMTEASSTFVLAAVPFFIAAGIMMEMGDITKRIIAVATAFIGHIRGSMGHITIAAMYFMSGVSGSEAADVAAVGTVMRKPLRRAGFGSGESTGILIAASVMGATVPPSIGLIIIAAATEISVATLFMAGFLPAAVLAVVLFATVYIRARMLGMPPAPRTTWKDRIIAVRLSLLALGLPLIIIGGMLFGIGTPTEISSAAVFYVFVIEVMVNRSLTLAKLGKSFVNTAVMTGMLLFIVSGAAGLVHVASIAGLPQLAGDVLIQAASGNGVLFLAISVLALIPLGMMMEGIAALLVFPPLLMPAALELGIDPVHYAILMFLAVYAGSNFPPVGAGYFFAASVVGADLKKAIAPSLGYLGIITGGIIILLLIPEVTLAVPRLLGM